MMISMTDSGFHGCGLSALSRGLTAGGAGVSIGTRAGEAHDD